METRRIPQQTRNIFEDFKGQHLPQSMEDEYSSRIVTRELGVNQAQIDTYRDIYDTLEYYIRAMRTFPPERAGIESEKVKAAAQAVAIRMNPVAWREEGHEVPGNALDYQAFKTGDFLRAAIASAQET